MRAALGIRVRTGRCTAVALRSPASRPGLAYRGELTTWLPSVPDSQQPHHAALGLAPGRAKTVVARASRAVRAATRRALDELVVELRDSDLQLDRVGIVVSSLTDPETIHNDHMRAHASEGRLFHEAVMEAADGLGLAHTTLLEGQVFGLASKTLRRSEAALRDVLVVLGREAGSPWRALEKAACLAAWIALWKGGR
jgi:hypothetical protein